MNKTSIIFIFYLVFIVKTSFTQTLPIDSLEIKLKQTTNNFNKVLLLNNYSNDLLSSNPNKSLKYIKQSIDLCDKYNFIIEKANAINLLGVYYRYMGDYVQSITYHYQSLKLYENVKDDKGIAITLFNIGNILLIQKNYKNALDYFNQSLRIREQNNEKKGIANCLNSMGIAYKSLGKLDTALVYYKKSLAIQKEIDDKSGIANALNNIAIIYYKKNDTTSTLAYFEKVIQIRKEMGDKFGEATSLFNIGLILEDKGEYLKAIDKFNESMKISIEIGDSVRVKDNCQGLFETYTLKKDFEQSYKYFDRFITLKDYINDEKKTNQIMEIQTK